MSKELSQIKRGRLQRRLAVGVAGLRAGTRILGQRSTDWLLEKPERERRRSELLQREAQTFVEELGRLKGSYVKIGQMLALFGEHLLPEELTDALHALEHQTTPLRWEVIEEHLRAELGPRLDELSVEPTPLAAASLGQVHRATVRESGEALCLKVQYPGVRETIDSDFADVVRMLKMANWLHSGRELNRWLEEIRTLLHEEVDYKREARMTREMAERLNGDARYRVPAVASRYSTNSVLALEYLEGLDPASPALQRFSLKRRNALASAMLDLFMREIFDWGVMQTDPNFGNYRIRGDKDGDQLVLLDFGAVRAPDKGFLDALRLTIASALHNHRDGVVEGIIALNCLSADHPESAKHSFADFCMTLLEPLRSDFDGIPEYAVNRRGAYRWRESRLLKRAGKVAAKGAFTPYFTMPPKEFALIARKLTGVFTFISVLGAEFNGHEVLARHVENWEHRSAQ